MSAVDVAVIEAAIRELGLAGKAVAAHVSLRSFGHLVDGPATIVDGFLAAGSTFLASTMAPGLFGISAPPSDRPARNGIDYAAQDASQAEWAEQSEVYESSRTEVAAWLGAFSAHVAARPDRIRCRHASGEFAAVGSRSAQLIDAETTADVFGPLRALVGDDGAVVLMGVGLNRMTLLHLAEVEAGRRPFIRWASGADGGAVRVRAGGCSEGFEAFADVLRTMERRVVVGESTWRVFRAREVLTHAAEAIRCYPSITHCRNEHCVECADAIAGGPLE